MIGLPSKVLKINDAAWLFAESRRTPMHVGMLATFSLPQDAGESYLGDLVDRWRQVRTFAPPFNYLIQGGLPRWKEISDERIDVDYHFRHSAVPSPGGERALGVLVSRLHSQLLDRRYPLWECHVIEGVEPGKWSLYIKVHHSQIDGVGGLRLARRMLCVDQGARDMLPPWAIGTSGPDQSGVDRAPRSEVAKADRGTDPLAGARSAASVVKSLTQSYAESLTGLGGGGRAVPFRAPRSVLNNRINAPRRFATQNYELARLKAVAEAAGGSLNDVFLAICGGALRHYLDELGALPEQTLTANVPVSVRPEGGADVGNAISFLYAELGTDVEDPVERIKVIHASTQRAKDRLPHAGGAMMDVYTSVLMGPFLAPAVLGVGGYGPPDANLVLSNVPGFKEPRYFDGSQLEAYFPMSLLFHGQALNITAVSSAGQFCIGYTGCRDTLPHLQRIAVYSGQALEELETALDLS